MRNQWKEWFQKWFRRENLVILILSGVLLFIIALPVKNKEDTAGTYGTNNVLKKENMQSEETIDRKGEAADEYCAALENRLAEILSKMSGVGQVEVMITLKNTGEKIIEKDGEKTRSDTAEEDGGGGSRVIAQTESRESTVYETGKEKTSPYVVKTLYPVVEGVVVVAEGADTGRNNKDISDAVCALFGIEAHKVKVVKMELQR